MEEKRIVIHAYFDIHSLYSYVGLSILRRYEASEWKDRVKVILEPVVLGAIFQATNNVPPVVLPSKRPYIAADSIRVVQWAGLPFKEPFTPPLKTNTTQALRILTAVKLFKPEILWNVLAAFFDAYWYQQLNIADLATLVHTLTNDVGLSETEVKELIAKASEAEVKAALRKTTKQAIDMGVFGCPSFAIKREEIPADKLANISNVANASGHEFFFGSDRLAVMSYYLNLPFHGPLANFKTKSFAKL